jgi:NAD(P)-dependent dehydrogenase (short-subunit alcohol dehydrogenase family)
MESAGASLKRMLPELVVSKQKLRQAEGSCMVHLKREEGRQNVGFSSRPFVLCGLPVRKPAATQVLYERRNGDFVLQITGHPNYGLPFGQDRIVPIYLATLAVRQQSQTIRFRTAAEMLDTFAMHKGGKEFRFGAFAEITEESFHLHYNINVLGSILTVQEAIKHFGTDGGSIINLSSLVGSHPVAGALLYASTKGAIETLTRGLALELAPRKIRVNAIAPGHTETEGNIAAGTFEGGAGAALAGKTPLGRLGRVADIAPLAVFLASDESAWITGEVIRAAGGLVVAT